jgi:hypothetical protein
MILKVLILLKVVKPGTTEQTITKQMRVLMGQLPYRNKYIFGKTTARDLILSLINQLVRRKKVCQRNMKTEEKVLQYTKSAKDRL